MISDPRGDQRTAASRPSAREQRALLERLVESELNETTFAIEADEIHKRGELLDRLRELQARCVRISSGRDGGHDTAPRSMWANWANWLNWENWENWTNSSIHERDTRPTL